MARRLKNLVIDEVSSVDRGAGQGVKVMLMKRDVSKAWSDEARAAASEARRSSGHSDAHSQLAGQHMLAAGIAGRAGNRAMESEHQAAADAHNSAASEFKHASGLFSSGESGAGARAATSAEEMGGRANAMSRASVGKVEKSGPAMEQIVAIAKAVGAENLLPGAREERDAVIDGAVEKLRADLASAKNDIDTGAAIQRFSKTFNMEDVMTPEEIQKNIAEGIAKATAPMVATISKLELDLAIERMPVEKRDFCKAMSEEDKKKFAAKNKDDQDEEVAEAKKRAAGDPVVKAIRDENEDLKKRLGTLEEKDNIAKFAKRAQELGLPETHGEIMRKAYAGDADAIRKHEEVLKGLNEQVRTGKVFAEFGTNQKTVAKSAFDEITAKAEELRKVDPKLTPEQAFDKVYNDQSSKDLRERDRAEGMAKRQAVAA